MAALNVFDEALNAVIVEPHAIDDGLFFNQAKHARPRVARLRARGDGANFDEAKTECDESVDVIAVFIQARREADRIGEIQTHGVNRLCLDELLRWQQAHLLGAGEQAQGNVMSGFRIESEEEGAGEFVKQV